MPSQEQIRKFQEQMRQKLLEKKRAEARIAARHEMDEDAYR